MKISIIIPAYNEEKTLREVLQKAKEAFEGCDYEILFVDDGSTDSTQNIAQSMQDGHMRILTHQVNHGKGRALQSGISGSTGDYIAIQDADLEYDPQTLRALWDTVRDTETVVYGKRSRGHGYLWNRFANILLSYTCNMLYQSSLFDIYTGYKIIPNSLAQSISLTSDGFEIEAEITAKLLLRKNVITEIPITYTPRTLGQGKKIRARDGFVGIWTLIKYRF